MKNDSFKAFLLETENGRKVIETRAEFIKLVRGECAEYLSHSRAAFPLNRGVRSRRELKPFMYYPMHKDREPTGMSKTAQAALDRYFNMPKYGGYPYRSAAVFVYCGTGYTGIYGQLSYIFPVDGYMICGSPSVRDLYGKTEDHNLLTFNRSTFTKHLTRPEINRYEELNGPNASLSPAEIKELDELNFKIFSQLGYFTDKNPERFIGGELMINGKGYYQMLVVNDKAVSDILTEIYEKK